MGNTKEHLERYTCYFTARVPQCQLFTIDVKIKLCSLYTLQFSACRSLMLGNHCLLPGIALNAKGMIIPTVLLTYVSCSTMFTIANSLCAFTHMPYFSANPTMISEIDWALGNRIHWWPGPFSNSIETQIWEIPKPTKNQEQTWDIFNKFSENNLTKFRQ